MAEEAPPPSFRLMNFVSEEQLGEAKKARGERADDGTAPRDRPLFEILKDNKDKRDAEFNERFKHRPPKALDEDETEFLDTLEMSRKEYERQMADDEAQQLRSFQVAVAVHSSTLNELDETPFIPKVEEVKPLRRKNPPPNPLGGLIIKVKPQAKKAKTDDTSSKIPSDAVKTSSRDTTKSLSPDKCILGGLVSYSDESDEENDS